MSALRKGRCDVCSDVCSDRPTHPLVLSHVLIIAAVVTTEGILRPIRLGAAAPRT